MNEQLFFSTWNFDTNSVIQHVEFVGKVLKTKVTVREDTYKKVYNDMSSKFKANLKTAVTDAYFYIAYMNYVQRYYISYETFAQILDIGARSVPKVLGALEANGYIEIDKKEFKDSCAKGKYDCAYKYYAISVYQPDLNIPFSETKFKTITFTLHKHKDESVETMANKPSVKSLPKFREKTQIVEDNNYAQPAYIAPYEDLELSIDDESLTVTAATVKWMHEHNEKPIVKNRIYHAFHWLPRELRKYVTYHGSYLVEAFDVHNCFMTLLCFKLKYDASIPRDEYERYRDLVVSGKFYESIMKFDKTKDRDLVKEEVSIFRNTTAAQRKSKKYNGELDYIEKWYSVNFPNILNFLDNYKRKKKVGKRGYSKCLQDDMEKIETEKMSSITKELHDLGYDVFQLHDAVYVTQACKTQQFDVDAANIVNKYIFNQL